MGKTYPFTQFYPILPKRFYQVGKTYHANPAHILFFFCFVVFIFSARGISNTEGEETRKLETKASSHEWQCIPAGSSVSLPRMVLITSRMQRSGTLPVLDLLTGQKSGFSPRRGDSLHQFRSNFAGPTGTWVRLAVQNFTSVGAGGGNSAQKIYKKLPLFGKESPRRGDSLDRFLKFLGAFICLTILH